ncbi:hypothetical protein EH223_18490 [candidate division KSB1 bacterium]|nr:hypothetical protein [candidate division KSB1 bacterium]RQW00474.1 MAG: hypothetical protein EH223_18490 [candidate division KSB1 bacterium]
MESQGYEKSDVSIRKVFLWAGGTVVGIVIIVVLLNALFIDATEKQVYESVLRPESIELRDLRAREIETLTSYRILDEQKGIVQIPVERAMQLVADEEFAKQLKVR